MRRLNLRAIAAATLLLAHLSASAEDIDLFANIVPPDSGIPNVILVLDNSANWSSNINADNCYYNLNGVPTSDGPKATNPGKEQGSKMAIEKCALYNVLDGLKNNPKLPAFNLAIMLLNESPYNGAYPRQAFLQIDSTVEGKANIDTLQAKIKGFTIGGDKGSNADFAKMLYEGYLWYKGAAPYNGELAPKRDTAAFSNHKYVNPSASSCAGNHIIFIANGAPENSENNDSKALLDALAGKNVAQLQYPTSEVKSSYQDNWADEMAGVIHEQDVSTKDGVQGITVHGVAVTGASSDGTFPNFINKIAVQGGGGFYSADDPSELALKITELLSSMLAEDSVFASASLPVSVSTQGTYLNRVYIGMFRPNKDANPRWLGNLKQYQFQFNTAGDNLYLADADKKAAIASSGGFIDTCARSFWTPTTSDTYWAFSPRGGCIAVADSESSNYPDGDIVEKGGAAYRLRSLSSSTNRQVKTCNDGSCAATTLAEITAANSGLAADVVAWLRGTDNLPSDVLDEKTNPSTNTPPPRSMRPTVHGDIVHSRPVAVDYGTDGVVVFYGGNDGMLRAINGNQASTDGNELWSFVAPEHYSKFSRLRDNTPEVYYPSTPTTTATRKDYFFDGPVTALKNGSSVMIYATMRRGGSSVYAFDVSTPATPSLVWRLNASSLTNVGQTWSSPKVFYAAGYMTTDTTPVPKPMLIMGGGYDTCEDGTFKGSDLNTCPTTGAKGNKVYVIDAADGTVLKTFNTDRSVVGDVTVVPNSITGLAEYAYAADTGGNVYRMNIASGLPSSWLEAVKIASLGCATSSCPGGTANRKFLFGPEVVVGPDYNSVLLGSGDREHPLIGNTTTIDVKNAFFMLKDDRSVSPALITLDQTVTYDSSTVSALMKIDPNQASLTEAEQERVLSSTNRGWYLQFGEKIVDCNADQLPDIIGDCNGDKVVDANDVGCVCSEIGTKTHYAEQVVTSVLAIYGTVTFSTHIPDQPAANSCGSGLGTARVYNVLYSNANPVGTDGRYGTIQGGGLPPSPTSGLVTIDGKTVPFVIGADPKSPLEGKIPKPPLGATPRTSRTYWYIQK